MNARPLTAASISITLPADLGLADLLPHLQPTGTWIRHGEGIIGLGTADGATAGGSERFAELAHWWESRTRTITDVERPAPLRDVPGCGPVAFTSVTYSSDSAAESVLILPEVILGSVAGRCWVTAMLPAGPAEGEPGGILAAVDHALRDHGLSLVPSAQGPQLQVAAQESDPAAPAAEPPLATTLMPGTHTEGHYLEAVAAGMHAITERRLEKLVLGRDVVVRSEAPLSSGEILAALARDYADCWTYRAGEVLGATPEMLVTVRGDKMAARVLAGTVEGSLPADQARQLLLDDPKQRTEHEIAVQSLLTQLAPVVAVISAQNPPTVLGLPNVYHLSTDVTGRLAATEGAAVPPALLVAERAHPTAAICGTPTATAAEFIVRLEQIDRGPFTGPVGWVDAQGNADFGIALRGGILSEDRRSVRLYAGCGIVSGSEPESELAETWAKLRPMLGALGVEPG